MAAPTKNKWLTLSLLAIVLPVSLLVTFKLTGVIPEPRKPETITLETVSWTMERPSDDVDINERVENAYADSEAAVGIGVHIHSYEENGNFWPWFDHGGVILGVDVISVQGVISSIMVKFCPTDANTILIVGQNEWELALSNVTVTRMKQIGKNSSEAYVYAQSSNSPCSLKTQTYWVFYDENVEDHQLKVIFEIVYFNGTTYRKIVAPIHLLVWRDAGHGFETAKEITPRVYKGSLHWIDDPEDYYSVFVEEGQIIHAQMISSNPNKDFDLHLYDPNRELKAYSYSSGNATADVIFEADSTGLWYVRLNCVRSFRGLYLLNVTVSPSEEG